MQRQKRQDHQQRPKRPGAWGRRKQRAVLESDWCSKNVLKKPMSAVVMVMCTGTASFKSVNQFRNCYKHLQNRQWNAAQVSSIFLSARRHLDIHSAAILTSADGSPSDIISIPCKQPCRTFLLARTDTIIRARSCAEPACKCDDPTLQLQCASGDHATTPAHITD